MGIVAAAFALRRQCREEYGSYLDAAYLAAHEACNGVLLNRRGQQAKIDPLSLFYGSADRAFLYASRELRDWWDGHRRMNYREFEEAWVAGRHR